MPSLLWAEICDLGFCGVYADQKRWSGWCSASFASSTYPEQEYFAYLRPISDKMTCNSMFVRRRKGCEDGGWRDSALAGGCVSPRCSYETGEAGDGGLLHLAWPAISSFSKATLGCPVPGVAFAFVVDKLPHLLSTKKSEALFVLGFFCWQRCWKLLTKGGVI